MGTNSNKNKKNISTTAGLTPAQLRHLARPREGFEAQLDVLIALYRDHPEELYLRSASADELEAALGEYRARVLAENAQREQLASAEEGRVVSGSQLWNGLLELYARARVVSRTDSTMKRGIASVEQFMSRPRRKRVAAPVTPPVAQPVSTTPTTVKT